MVAELFMALPEWNYVGSASSRVCFNSPGWATFIVVSQLLIYAAVVVGVMLRRKAGRSTFWVPLSGGGLVAVFF